MGAIASGASGASGESTTLATPRRPALRPLLLDTHALLWWLLDSPELSMTARAAIAAPERRVLVSAATGWEIATKYRIGKLPEARDIVEKLPTYLRKQRFEVVSITLEHSMSAGALPGPHRDPFDRMLIAQAAALDAVVATVDPVFVDYGARVLW